MANRLETILFDIIHKNQNTFVPGRLITNNALMAFEVFYHMRKIWGKKKLEVFHHMRKKPKIEKVRHE